MDKKVAVILMGIVVVFVGIIAIKQYFVLRDRIYAEAFFDVNQK
jgi:hypothetical protein